jgi:hypothetical protein
MTPLWVWLDCLALSAVCVYKRLLFLVFPEERKRDLVRVTESYNLWEEGKKKYLFWRNSETVSNFFYTWNMVADHFYT